MPDVAMFVRSVAACPSCELLEITCKRPRPAGGRVEPRFRPQRQHPIKDDLGSPACEHHTFAASIANKTTLGCMAVPLVLIDPAEVF